MNCIVTAGPTFEPLDKVRRLTNFSTGRLGAELANFLVLRRYQVTLFIAEQAAYYRRRNALRVETFTTTASLRTQLQARNGQAVEVVFHAAAVSDFMLGKIWLRSAKGNLTEVRSGKISTRRGTLLAELVPTPKIIAELRDWFPKARLIGWKYEVEGDRAGVIGLAREQLRECRTDACVANGSAYGAGFGLVTSLGKHLHLPDTAALFTALEEFIRE